MSEQNIILYFYCCERTKKIVTDFLHEFHADDGRLLNDEVFVYTTDDSVSFRCDENKGEWIPINKNQDSWIKIGLSPLRAFSVYYSVTITPIKGLIITFTVDNGIVFGLEISSTGLNIMYVKDLVSEFKKKYSATLYGIFSDLETPPFSKLFFIDACKRAIVSNLSKDEEINSLEDWIL
jgi:hypothetical protein